MENYTRLLEYLDENKTIHIRETFIQAFKKMGSSSGFDFWLIIIAIILFALTLTLPMYYWVSDKIHARFNPRSSFLPIVSTLSIFAILLVIANIFLRLTLDSGTIENQENKIILDNLYSNTYIINKSEITDTDKEILDYLESVLQNEGDLNKLERISINNKKIMFEIGSNVKHIYLPTQEKNNDNTKINNDFYTKFLIIWLLIFIIMSLFNRDKS